MKLVLGLLVVVCLGFSQTPSGRWDGTIEYGPLKVPLQLHFESTSNGVRGMFVNGESRVASSEGHFDNGELRLSFASLGTRLEAKLADGGLKGVYGNEKLGMRSLNASAYCTCAYEGEAGPDISGTWEFAGEGWQLSVQRKGEDTLATLRRPGRELGPLHGRFDGVTFALHYFDGIRAAVLELEPRKDGTFDAVLSEPGTDLRKLKLVRSSAAVSAGTP